jgi:hypothetical protein
LLLPQTQLPTPFQPLFELQMEISSFRSSWSNCGIIANYVADMISDHCPDPVRHSNFFSAALNELLEEAARSDQGHGMLVCQVALGEKCHRLELAFPCPNKLRAEYEAAVVDLGVDSASDYIAILQDLGPQKSKATLLGLAVNFDAQIALRDAGGDGVFFVVDLPIAGDLR